MKRLSADTYKDRIIALQRLMLQRGVDAYYVGSEDFHASEYVGDYFKCREFLSGFDGSAGEMVITAKGAWLWTDGRYFLQAEEQLEGTGITLMRDREPGVPRLEEFLEQNMSKHYVLGFDGRLVSNYKKEKIEKAGKVSEPRIRAGLDLVGELWKDRPALSAEKAWLLSEEYTGMNRVDKLAQLREDMAMANCDAHLIASLDDIAWLYQIRGGDIAYNPVALSFSIVTNRLAMLYINPEILTEEDKEILNEDGVIVRPYEQVYQDLRDIQGISRILLEKKKCNCMLLDSLLRRREKVDIVDKPNPTALRKCRKTDREVANMRLAHIRDGAAVTRMMYYLKNLSGSEEIKAGLVTELDAAEKLLAFRKEQEGFIEESFAPIIATGAHGAIVHYEPTPETNMAIEDNAFLLMDTGGQYYQGTTDITRTILIGKGTEKMRRYYTAVLKGNLALGDAVFRKGCTGIHLDILARKPLWELGLDYNHGTGHGVGYLLNVHEGPQGIRLREADGKVGAAFEENMITSNEPGVYLAGEFGIRTENLVLCVKKHETEMGEFYGFETLTLVPFDKDAIVLEMLTPREIRLIDEYHQTVLEKISPLLPENEREWLAKACAPIGENN